MLKQRIIYIDNMKVFLTCLVVAHHAAQAYGPTGGVWPVSNNEKILSLANFFFINAAFMMGLYFFISGYFMMFSIKRKTKLQFSKDRLKRLGIPLLFFTLLLFLPFNYLNSDKSQSLFIFFIDSYLHHPPTATGHLWFVASLLLYSFIYIMFFLSNKQIDAVASKKFKFWYIPVYIIVLAIISGLVRTKYPIDTWRTWLIPVEVAHIPQYMSLFFIGTLFQKHDWMNQLNPRAAVVYLLTAILAYYLSTRISVEPAIEVYVESLTESMLCVGISLALFSLFKFAVNHQPKWLQILSENTYGIYLFHVFIVIALQLLMHSWLISPMIKFILVTVFGILFSCLLSYILRKNTFIKAII